MSTALDIGGRDGAIPIANRAAADTGVDTPARSWPGCLYLLACRCRQPSCCQASSCEPCGEGHAGDIGKMAQLFGASKDSEWWAVAADVRRGAASLVLP